MDKSNRKSETRFENNWFFKTLEILEKEYWEEIPDDATYLVTTCHQLRKKQLNEFDTEDLRILIGQNIGLKFLIPLALKTLDDNILAEGHFYKGDLLKMVLTSDTNYWSIEKDLWAKMCDLFKSRRTEIEKEAANHNTGRNILKAYKEFEKINA